MQLSHLIQWKLPARWSGNRAYARWVMLFIRLLWKGPMEPCTFFVSLSDSQSDKGNRNENAHICKNRAHFTDLLKYHPSGKYSWPRSKSASQHVFPLFFLSGESAIRSNPHFVFWHWAFILATHLDLTAPNSLAHGSRLLECTTSEIGHYLIGGLWAVCLVLALPTWLGFNCIRALAMSFDFWLVLPTNWYLFMAHCSFTFSYQ